MEVSYNTGVDKGWVSLAVGLRLGLDFYSEGKVEPLINFDHICDRIKLIFK